MYSLWCNNRSPVLVTGSDKKQPRSMAELEPLWCVSMLTKLVTIRLSKPLKRLVDQHFLLCKQRSLNELKYFSDIKFTISCDVSNRLAVMELAQDVTSNVGIVTILVNNAGIMPCRPLIQQTEKEIRSVFAINVLGNLWVTLVLYKYFFY